MKAHKNSIFPSGLIFLFLSAIVHFVCLSSIAVAEAPVKGKSPITIESDRLETFEKGKLVVFSGHVKADKDTTVIHCDELSIFYQQKDGSGKEADGEMQSADIERIEAKENVTIKGDNGILTGDHAVLYNKSQKVVMTGRAVMKDGDNIIQGDRITFFLSEGKGVVESLKKNKVKATIYSKEEQAAAK